MKILSSTLCLLIRYALALIPLHLLPVSTIQAASIAVLVTRDAELDVLCAGAEAGEKYGIFVSRPVYACRYGGDTLYAVKTRPGLVNAALCAQMMIDHFNPELLLSIGLCAAVNDDIPVGTVVMAGGFDRDNAVPCFVIRQVSDRGDLKLDGGDADAALAVYQDAMNEYPFSLATLTAYNKLAPLMGARGQLPEISHIPKPEDPMAWQQLLFLHGRAAEKLDHYEQALALLEPLMLESESRQYSRALSLVRCYIALGEKNREEGNLMEAMAWLNKAMEVRPLTSKSIYAFKQLLAEGLPGKQNEWTQKIMALISEPEKYSDDIAEAWIGYLMDHDGVAEAERIMQYLQQEGRGLSGDLKYLQYTILEQSASSEEALWVARQLLNADISATKKNRVCRDIAAIMISQGQFSEAIDLIRANDMSATQINGLVEAFQMQFGVIQQAHDTNAVQAVHDLAATLIVDPATRDIALAWVEILLENEQDEQAMALLRKIGSVETIAESGYLSTYFDVLFMSGAGEKAWLRGMALLSGSALAEKDYIDLRFRLARYLVEQQRLEEVWSFIEASEYPLQKNQIDDIEQQIKEQVCSLMDGDDIEALRRWASVYLAHGRLSERVAGTLAFAAMDHAIGTRDFDYAANMFAFSLLNQTQIRRLRKSLDEVSEQVAKTGDIQELIRISGLAQGLALDDTYYEQFTADMIDKLSMDAEQPERAVEYAMQLGDQLGAVGQARLRNLAELAERHGRFEASTYLLNHFLTTYPDAADRMTVTRKLVDGQLAQQQEDLAWNVVEQQLALFEDVEDAVEFAKDMNKHFTGRASRYVEALNAYILMNTERQEDICEAHQNLGAHYLKLRSYGNATIHLEEAFRNSSRYDRNRQVAIGTELLEAATLQGADNTYIAQLLDGLEGIIEGIEDKTAQGKLNYRIAKILDKMGVTEESRYFFENAMALGEDTTLAPAALYQLAKSYEYSGDIASAMDTYITYLERYGDEKENGSMYPHIVMANLLALSMDTDDNALQSEMRYKAEAMINGVQDPFLALDLAKYYGDQGFDQISEMLTRRSYTDAVVALEAEEDKQVRDQQLRKVVEQMMKMGYYTNAVDLMTHFEQIESKETEEKTEAFYEAEYQRARAMLRMRNVMDATRLLKQLIPEVRELGYHNAEERFLYLLTKTSPDTHERWKVRSELIERFPDSRYALESKILWGGKYFAQGDYERALSLAHDALALSGESGSLKYEPEHHYNALYLAALIYEAMGMQADADSFMEKIHIEYGDAPLYVQKETEKE
ncbi:MAG: tetratricopeptide repeat protein [Spartobacteria bacterium]|nr:tetratricopeptide repeat protein [Spartobacteria bacterium]